MDITYVKDNRFKYASLQSNGVFIKVNDDIYGIEAYNSEANLIYWDGSTAKSLCVGHSTTIDETITNSSYEYSVTTPIYNTQVQYTISMDFTATWPSSVYISIYDGTTLIDQDLIYVDPISPNIINWTMIHYRKFDNFRTTITPAFTGQLVINFAYDEIGPGQK